MIKSNAIIKVEPQKKTENSKREQAISKDATIWKQVALIAIVILALTQLDAISDFAEPYFKQGNQQGKAPALQDGEQTKLEQRVLPEEGVPLPVRWNSFGNQMVETGVIDKEKFEALYAQRGGLDENAKQLLYGSDNGNLKMDAQNANFLLNLLWAFGLSNENPILEEGPIQDPKYNGADRFASTGGWSLAKGDVMEHYSKHQFVTLTAEQQDTVERVAKNIYRPCCGNSTYFPDCNHGMAMLGLLELLSAQGASEELMYKTALQVNAYWFPDTYLTLAQYFENEGVLWEQVNPKEVLGEAYSSARGYQNILTKVEPQGSSGGGSCGA